MKIIAFIHSHARDPDPSAEDRLNMRLLPMPWIIVGDTKERVVHKFRAKAFYAVSGSIQTIALNWTSPCRLE
jgi:proteasome lid subunit RPN8/RPN11